MDKFATTDLLNWYDRNKRDLPWRRSENPYHIWISEVMCQQTRVDTAIPYYHRFTTAFPTVQDLAEASRQDVLKVWEGLGYYSRARNLQDAAKHIVKFRNGVLPDTYKEICSLSGIGPYTASAILSIAYNQPYSVVDGNVIRVITRFNGIEEDIRSQGTKNQVREQADLYLDKNRPGDFNQALMELGATVCKPVRPVCGSCPLSTDCIANRTAATGRIPYKSPVKSIPHHDIGAGLIVDSQKRLLIALRPEHAMLGGLWEFPGGKRKTGEKLRTTVRRELKEELNLDVRVLGKFMELKHAYSHFRITLHAYWCLPEPSDQQPAARQSQEIRRVSVPELAQYPFPKANKILTEKLIREGLPDSKT
ncbi:MAG: A/G-specific adenine glycosylase [Balneolaceae bacterium]